MKEWLPTIASFCTVVLATVAIITFVQAGHGQLRADMRDMRTDMREMRTEMRAGDDSIRADIREMRTEMREEHAEMRDRLNSIDRRASRIEGQLFGIEVAPEPPDGE